jgi:hypothetical protein
MNATLNHLRLVGVVSSNFFKGNLGGNGNAQWVGQRREGSLSCARENDLDSASQIAKYGLVIQEFYGNFGFIWTLCAAPLTSAPTPPCSAALVQRPPKHALTRD